MQIKTDYPEDTKYKLTITADKVELEAVKTAAISRLGKDVKVAGFRAGKAPANLVEKQLAPAALQSEFLDLAVNQLYATAVTEGKLRPVAQPEVNITKFVPYDALEFTAEAECIGEVTLPDYKKIKLEPKKVIVTADEVNKVIDDLRQRGATKDEVKRAAKDGDEVTLYFVGSDAKTGDLIDGAEGKDYPLVIGSKNFIPGFEEELIGLKAGDSKTFDITFPEDYNVADLKSRKVKFEIKIGKVQELKLAKLDEDFAKTLGPFNTVAELKSDIKKQLEAEKAQENRRAYENELMEKIAAETRVEIPKALVDDELTRIEENEKRDLAYRGQTWQEHLDAEGVTAEEHAERNRQPAEIRVKVGLILGEVADKEKVTITPDELNTQIELLKGQYPDEKMQAELDKPENQRDIMSRMLTEKTLSLLAASAGYK